MNVDILRVIQIGITFSDDSGNFPSDAPSTWQFHFSFSLQSDTYARAPRGDVAPCFCRIFFTCFALLCFVLLCSALFCFALLQLLASLA